METKGHLDRPIELRLEHKSIPTNTSRPFAPFAIPATPPVRARPPTRPLGMSSTSNLPAGGSIPASEGTPRLKRLSLVPNAKPKPAVLAIPTNGSNGDIEESVSREDGAGAGDGARSARSSTPVGLGPPSTPRSALSNGKRYSLSGMRSSISYSPAPRQSTHSIDLASPAATPTSTRSMASASGSTSARGVDGAEMREESQDGESRSSIRERRKGETLLEKHSDLLTLIAQRERRVNELKQELASQEASLAQLKSRWTTIVTRSTHTHQPHHPTSTPSTSSTSGAGAGASASITHRSTPSSSTHPLTTTRHPRARPRPQSIALSASSSTTTSTSTAGSLPSPSLSSGPSSDILASPGVESISSLLASLNPGVTEGLISAEAVESSKRFWGQLVKTVSAAAGGTVPPQEPRSPEGLASHGQGDIQGVHGNSQGFDLSSLKSLLPSGLPAWSSGGNDQGYAYIQPGPSSSSTSSRAPSSRPPRPVNASRLNRAKERDQTNGSGGVTITGDNRGEASLTQNAADAVQVDLLGDVEEAESSAQKVFTPMKAANYVVDPSHPSHTAPGGAYTNGATDGQDGEWGVFAGTDGLNSQKKGEDDEDEWGW